MARTVEDIVKQQLGSLLLEIAMLTSQLEVLREDNTKQGLASSKEVSDGKHSTK